VTVSALYSGGNLNLSGTGGLAGSTYYVIATNNLAAPSSLWPVVSSGQFDGSGNFNVNLPMATTNKAQFFRIKQ
jgi:hypothetical protein